MSVSTLHSLHANPFRHFEESQAYTKQSFNKNNPLKTLSQINFAVSLPGDK